VRGVPTVFFIFLKESFDWPITNIFGTWDTHQHKSLNMLSSPKQKHSLSCFSFSPPLHPSPNLYTWNLNHEQIVWDKIWGGIENILRNTLGTWWEQPKNKKSHHPGPQTFKEKNLSPLEPSHWLAWNFYFQNSLSPFSTWTNTPIMSWRNLLIRATSPIHLSY